MPAKAVFLTSPTYRRWLTPDFTDIEFELEGFDPKDQTPWQAHLLTRDLDSEAESHSFTPLDGAPKTFPLPAPKFHSRAEIILMIEDRRTRDPVCEGRWQMTNIAKEDLPNLSYFDSRGVFFHEGQGRFPIVAAGDAEPAVWESIAKTGYTGVVAPPEKIDDRSAERARSLGLLLFAALGTPHEDPAEKRKAEVHRLMRYPSVACYSARANMEWLAACRMADSSRPIFTVSASDVKAGELPAACADFQDVVALQSPPPKDARMRPNCARFGRAHFAWIEEKEIGAGGLPTHLYTAVARGAAAFGILGDVSKLTAPALAASIRDMGPLVHAVVHGVPERGEESKDRWVWRRRLGPNERAVIEVKRSDPPTAAFTVYRDSP